MRPSFDSSRVAKKGTQMKTIIRIIELADGREFGGEILYIAGYDNSTEDELGIGTVDCTSDRAKAKRFDEYLSAFHFWKQESRTVPTRPDGKPNRPLTSFTVSFEHVQD